MLNTQNQDNILKGIMYILAGIVTLTVSDLMVKQFEGRYHVFEILFFRALFGFIPIFFFVRFSGGVAQLRTNNISMHISRSLAAIIGVTCCWYALGFMPIANVYALEFGSPLFITILSIYLLKEKIGIHRWAAVTIGFIGVLIVLNPTAEGFNSASVFALVGSFFFALYLVLIRKGAGHSSPASMVFYLHVVGVVVGGIAMIFLWKTPESNSDLIMLVCVGIAAGMGQYFMTKAFSTAPASVVAPFEYSALLTAAFADYVVWSVLPSNNLYFGGTILIACGLYIAHRERIAENT